MRSERRRPLSLNARLVLAASLVLAAFLGVTGLALERAFARASLALVEERLLADVYGLLAAAEVDGEGRIRIPEALPEPRFSAPGSGLYAEVVDGDGHRVWRSPSMVGRAFAPPAPVPGAPGRPLFSPARTSDGEPLLAVAFAVRWELGGGREADLVLRVAEDRALYEGRRGRFRRSLWGWLAAAGAGLLLAQGAVLAWCLAPLRRLAREVREVETGAREALSEGHPRELEALARNLNALIDVGRRQIARYRNALADLAHSLKTPLALLRGLAEDGDPEPERLRHALREEVRRMDRTVEYQLQRAAAAGAGAPGRLVPVAPVAQRLRETLAKVHAGRGLAIELAIEGGCALRGDEGDLVEVLGNLLDNACKWARSRVVVRGESAGGRVVLSVEDDGPGIDPRQAEAILARGARADTAVPGHGIGLAVVREIVEEAYGGHLAIEPGPLGGARVVARFGGPAQPSA